MFSRHKEAFTLIELLIVVAIIAILAAVAIPNYLDAQTRAKYARCYGDTRNLATAIEVYRVDNNEYVLTPLSPDPCLNAVPIPEATWLRLIPVTTPIAYMSQLPIDEFDDDMQPWPASTWLLPGADNDPYNYQNLERCEGSTTDTGHPLYMSRFKVLSPGLARNPYPILWAVPYDPTNGTVSNGVCGFTDRGMITGQIFNYNNTAGLP